VSKPKFGSSFHAKYYRQTLEIVFSFLKFNSGFISTYCNASNLSGPLLQNKPKDAKSVIFRLVRHKRSRKCFLTHCWGQYIYYSYNCVVARDTAAAPSDV
jgi:hypothetical protein